MALTLGLIALLLLVYYTFSVNKKTVVEHENAAEQRIYRVYQFSASNKIINIGTQPLYMPTGLITEVMKRDRLLKKALTQWGVEVRYFPFLKGADVNHFFKQGKLVAGIGGDMPAITIAATSKVMIPVMVQQGFLSIVARQQMLLSQLADKKIGFAFGSNAHYMLLDALASEGLTEADVTLVPMEIHQMGEALHSGKIEAFSAWEPTPAEVIKQYPEFVRIHQKLSTGYLYFSKAYFETRPELTQALVAAVLHAIQWLRSKREHLLQASIWAKAAGEHLSGVSSNLDPAEIANLAVADIIGGIDLPMISERQLRWDGVLHRQFEFIKELGKVPAAARWEEVLNSFEPQVIAALLEKPEFELNQFEYE